MDEPIRGAAPRRPALIFIFVTVLLDMLALGMMIPVLPKLVVAFEGGVGFFGLGGLVAGGAGLGEQVHGLASAGLDLALGVEDLLGTGAGFGLAGFDLLAEDAGFFGGVFEEGFVLGALFGDRGGLGAGLGQFGSGCG